MTDREQELLAALKVARDELVSLGIALVQRDTPESMLPSTHVLAEVETAIASADASASRDVTDRAALVAKLDHDTPCATCGHRFDRHITEPDIQINYLTCADCERCDRFSLQFGEAVSLPPSASRAVSLTPSEIRDGEDNDGPLQSTDLFLVGRGISLLVNVPAGSVAHYAMRVDKGESQSGTVGALQRLLLAALPEGDETGWRGIGDWSDEQLAAALLSDLYRVLDAGGLSSGRSLFSTLLEPAQSLLAAYRPSGDVATWPDRRTMLTEAGDRLRARSERLYTERFGPVIPND